MGSQRRITRQRLVGWIRGATLIVTLFATLWTFQQNPLAAPLTQRSLADARISLEKATARNVSAEFLAVRIEEALADNDPDRLEMLLELADEHAADLPPVLITRTENFLAEQESLLTRAGQCAACAADIANCQRLSQIASCALPVELTPIGDLNALRRAGVDWTLGNEIDQVDVSLALIGLGATGVSLASGGSSLALKAGATFLRLARRLKALTPPFATELADLSANAVEWSQLPTLLRNDRTFADISDAATIAVLSKIATDLNTLRLSTSSAEALVLMKYADSSAELADLARLSQAAGSKTRHSLEVLGKSRTFRSMYRLSNLAIAAILLALALAAQIAALLPLGMRRIIRKRKV